MTNTMNLSLNFDAHAFGFSNALVHLGHAAVKRVHL